VKTYTSNSERASALCETRWLFRYGLGLEVPMDSYAMSVGKAWHEVQEVYWIHGFDAGMARATAMVREDQLVPITGDRIGLDVLEPMLERYDLFHENWIKLHGDLTILGQEVSIERATTVNGRWSSASRWLGIVDKIVRDSEGKVWILEHKTTGLHPTDWLDAHRADYQPRIYAWLLRALDLFPVGCIYDVVRRGGVTQPRRNKDGSLAKLRKGTLPKMSASDWLNNLTDEEEEIPWVMEVYQGLRGRDADGYWQAREWITFEPGEVDRAAAEAHTVATRLRRHREAIEPLRSSLYDEPPRSPHELGTRVSALIREVWGQFPRNVGECKRWGRLCEYAAACANPTTTTCSELRIRAQTKRTTTDVIATHRPTDRSPGEGSPANRAGSP
jgi:hypothetical protein